MHRAWLVTSLLVATTNVAVAGGYVGIGIGTAPAMTSDDDSLDSDGRSGRLFVGSRWGQISVEGAVHNFGVLAPGRDPYEMYQGSVAGKASVPLGNGFEVFGKLGLQRTWLVNPIDSFDKAGNGFLLGAGVEYKLNLAVAQISLFIDYQFNKATVEGDRESSMSARACGPSASRSDSERRM
ncbi:MAG: outer membrane beta-barrel protein [Kofleriaceae bacterium]